jgi:hypothetical protein
MANGNSDGTIYLSTKYPPAYWGIAATLSQTKDIVIKSGASISDSLDFTAPDLVGYSVMGIITASTWTTATMSVQGSVDNINFFPIHTWTGTGAYNSASTVAASQMHIFDGLILRGIPYVKFKSGTFTVGVNQTNTTILTVILGTI